MKTSENKNLKIFKGAGFLLSFVMTIVTAITVFVLSNNVTVSISASIPIGVVLGIGLEERFQKGDKIISPKMTKVLIGLLSVGFIVFFALFFLLKLK